MLYICFDGYQDQYGKAKEKKYVGIWLKKQLFQMNKESEDRLLSMLNQERSSWMNDREQIDMSLLWG